MHAFFLEAGCTIIAVEGGAFMLLIDRVIVEIVRGVVRGGFFGVYGGGEGECTFLQAKKKTLNFKVFF
jgi:hypothetical protein